MVSTILALTAAACLGAGGYGDGCHRDVVTFTSEGVCGHVCPLSTADRWYGRSLIGPRPHYSLGSVRRPGPANYGAPEHSCERVYVSIHGLLIVSIDPWTPITKAGLRHLERARIRWLHDHGYTGGVRTFVNERFHRVQHEPVLMSDAAALEGAEAAPAGLPDPRAILRMREGWRSEPTFRVDAGDDMRISWPHARASRVPVVRSPIEIADAD